MSTNSLQKLTNDYSSLFTSLTSRVEVFRITQDNFVNSLIEKIRSTNPDITASQLAVIAPVYGICITDGIFEDYDIELFLRDILYLKSLAREEITNSDPIEEKESKSILMKHDDGLNDWQNIIQDGDNQSNVEMKVLTAYYQAMNLIKDSLRKFNSDLILHHVNERPRFIIVSFLIRQHLLSLFHGLMEVYNSIPLNIDIRFITAQIEFAFLSFLKPVGQVPDQYTLFEKIKKVYPLGQGRDLLWDLSEQIIFNRYFDEMRELLQSQIDNLKKKRTQERIIVKNQMELTKLKPREDGNDQLKSKIDQLLNEVYVLKRPITSDKCKKIRPVIETILNRRAIKEFGKKDIPMTSKYRDYFIEEFFTPIFEDYPQLFVNFIDIKDYSKFIENHDLYLKGNMDYIMIQFWFQMRKHGVSDRAISPQIAEGFSSLLCTLLQSINK